MSAGKFKSLKMDGLNDVLTITATLQLTKTQIRNVSENFICMLCH